MMQQTEPVIIIAGTSYPGVYKTEVFRHLAACLEERKADIRAAREERRREYESFWEGMEVGE